MASVQQGLLLHRDTSKAFSLISTEIERLSRMETPKSPDPEKITPLFPGTSSAVPLPPDPEVVGKLEWLLEEAKSGKLIGLACCYYSAHEQTGYAAIGKVTWPHMVATLERLKLELLMQQGTI